MGSRVCTAVVALVLAPLVGLAGCAPPEAAEARVSTTLEPLLSEGQLGSALLTQRTVGGSYTRQDAGAATAPAAMGCLDALDPALLGAGIDGPQAVARVEYDTAAALPSSSVASLVVSFGSDRAVDRAWERFAVAAGGCTAVSSEDGAITTDLEVLTRLVPVKPPVEREVLVEARGTVGNGVTSPAVGVSVKVGRVGRQLVAVQTTGVGGEAPDITAYYNIARARLLAVLDGTDPGPGRPVRT